MAVPKLLGSILGASQPDGQLDVRAPEAVPVVLEAQKNVIGAPLPADYFRFGVFNRDNILVNTATTNADGRVIFPPILFTQAGIYNYTIRELTLDGNGWTTDRSVFRVNIIIIEVGEEQLIAEISYPDGFPTFTNEFSATVCSGDGQQMTEVCLPVSVKPFANVGVISTRCCGPARITPGTDICEGTPDGNCDFTISQTICVDVPVEFGAEVTPGEVHVGCTGNDCANCPPPGDE
jgi:pilin isopeptide linkage protein